MHLKISSEKRWPFCSGGDELTVMCIQACIDTCHVDNVVRRCGCVPSDDVLSLRDALTYRDKMRQEGNHLELCYSSENGKLTCCMLNYLQEI